MAEEVHSQAREIGTVCSIKYPLSKKDLEQHGNWILIFSANDI